jgi:hypothetical protein
MLHVLAVIPMPGLDDQMNKLDLTAATSRTSQTTCLLRALTEMLSGTLRQGE